MAGSVRRLSGNTATHFDTAFSGSIIRVMDDGEHVLVQHFFPLRDKTAYTVPVVRKIEYFYDDEMGIERPGFTIEINGEAYRYFTDEFIRDKYLIGV